MGVAVARLHHCRLLSGPVVLAAMAVCVCVCVRARACLSVCVRLYLCLCLYCLRVHQSTSLAAGRLRHALLARPPARLCTS